MTDIPSTADIPWAKLGIPEGLRGAVDPSSPRSVRMAAARAALPAAPEALLGTLYVLTCGDDVEVRNTAIATLKSMPGLVEALSQRTYTKVLELIAFTRHERVLDERIMLIRATNDRTATLIASRADATLCDLIAENHERLLLTPEVLVALHQNPRCSDAPLERATAFLRMQQSLPELPPTRPELEQAAASRTLAPAPQAPPLKLDLFDLDQISPDDLDGFSFDFKDDDNFSLDLLDDGPDDVEDPNLKANLEKRIAAMSVGNKLKLAYVGNKSVRSLLIRDRNKLVAVAVVKSGRLSEAEVLSHAGNRNLPDEALREIATNREWTRKYPVKVALVNNPKCPPSVAVALVAHLQIKDLSSLSRNRNVSSVVFTLAGKIAKKKSG